jgi:L-rhamnose isomerase
MAVADLVDEILEKRWAEGDESVSNRALADKLGVDERRLREYRDGEKYLPVAALMCLPQALAEDVAEQVLAARREQQGDRRAVLALGRAVARVEAMATHTVMRNEDRRALRRAVDAHMQQLAAVLAMLEEDA